MATEAQLQRERDKRKQLQQELAALEEENGVVGRRIGVRALKAALSAGGSSTAGAISQFEYGRFKARYINWGLGGICKAGQVFTQSDGLGDVVLTPFAAMFDGQLAVSASGAHRKKKAGNGNNGG